MKHSFGVVIITMNTLTALLLLSCKDNATSPGPLDDLETRFVSGYIAADLMPAIPPDPIICQLVLIAKNKSSSSSLTGLNIQQAEVFLDSASLRLGTISFSTTWDGQLGPNEEDTVRLSKVIEQTLLFTPPCGKYVYLNLAIKNQTGASRTMKIDSLLFGCAF